MLATSIKADLVQDTLAARSRRGEAKLFDPTNSTGLPTAAWSPIAASTSWSAARRTAAGILLIREKDAFAASVDDRHWKPAAARLLAPVLLAAAHSSRPMGEVLRWLARLEAEGTVDEIADVLATCGADGADVALDVLLGLQDRDSRYRSSVIATLETALDPWLEPSVARATGTAGGIDPEWLLDGSNTLYLSAPAYDQHRLSGLFTALINAVVEEAFARSSRTGRPIDPPLLLCLDEAANVAPLPNLGEIASTAAGQGVQVLSVFQNLSQISERWGRDRAETVMANHVARLFGSGIADRATLDYLGAVLGEEEIEKVSTHRQRLELDLGSRTYSKDFKRLAAPDRVRQAERDTALLVYGNIAPAWISLRPWYRDRGLRAQVDGGAARRRRAGDRAGRRRGRRMSRSRARTAARGRDRAPAGELVLAEEGGVRVFYIAAPTMQDLVDRLALVLGEHMHDGDELHVTYNAMQSGWTEHPPKKGDLIRRPEAGWTELRFEYSAFVVLRERQAPPLR